MNQSSIEVYKHKKREPERQIKKESICYVAETKDCMNWLYGVGERQRKKGSTSTKFRDCDISLLLRTPSPLAKDRR